MIVDVHSHLSTLEQWGEAAVKAFGSTTSGNSGANLHVTPERHLAATALADKVIVFGINSIALKMCTPNDAIADYAKAHPDRIIGFMSVDPNDPDALDEIDRSVAMGLRGIKMSPIYQMYHPCSDNARRVHRRAEELGLPIITHAAMNSIPQTPMEWANPLLYDGVAREFPNLKIILAHVGLPWFYDAMIVVRKHANVYADIVATTKWPWWGYQAIAAFYECGLTGKLMFGSDFPLMEQQDTLDGLRKINKVVEGTGMPQIPAEVIEGIIHRDSLALLGLE